MFREYCPAVGAHDRRDRRVSRRDRVLISTRPSLFASGCSSRKRIRSSIRSAAERPAARWEQVPVRHRPRAAASGSMPSSTAPCSRFHRGQGRQRWCGRSCRVIRAAELDRIAGKNDRQHDRHRADAGDDRRTTCGAPVDRRPHRRSEACGAAIGTVAGMAERFDGPAEPVPSPIARLRIADRVTYSPLIEQYLSMKARYPEAIVLARVGDFYEAYGDDAETIARAAADRADLERGRRTGSASRWRACRITRWTVPGASSSRSSASWRSPSSSKRRCPTSSTKRDVVRVVTPGDDLSKSTCSSARSITTSRRSRSTAKRSARRTPTSRPDASRRPRTPAIAPGRSHRRTRARRARPKIVADVPREMRGAIEAALPATCASPRRRSRRSSDRERQAIVGFSLDESLAIHRALDGLGDFVRRVGIGGERRCASPRSTGRRRFSRSMPTRASISS